MKKILLRISALVLIAACLLGLTSCGEKQEKQITTLAELNGKNIAVETGTIFIGNIKASGKLDDSPLMYSLYASDAFAMLLSGKVEGYVTDNVAAQTLLRQYDDIEILEETVADSYFGIVFGKGDRRAEDFNKALAAMRDDGTLQALSDKWLGDDMEAKVIDIPGRKHVRNSKGTLCCIVNSDYEPICYRDRTGQLKGFDIEMIMIAANRAGYDISFKEKVFDDIIPSIYAKEGDLAVAGISITSERQEMVDFSDPYLYSGTVALVRKVGRHSFGAAQWLSLKNGFRRVIIDENRWKDLASGMGITALLTVSSIAVGFILGMLLYFVDYSKNRFGRLIVKIINKSVTFLPVCVRLMIWFYIFLAGLKGNGNLLAAFITLSVGFAISVYGCVSGAVEKESGGQADAASSMGYTRFNALRHIFLPQAFPDFMASAEAIVVDQIKCTALVEFIAVQDFQAVLDGISVATYESFIPVIVSVIFYFAFEEFVCWLVRIASRKLIHDRSDIEYKKNNIMKGRI